MIKMSILCSKIDKGIKKSKIIVRKGGRKSECEEKC
jgi:hypothetical protein